MIKKSIVLSGVKGNEKAVLSLESEGKNLSGRLRLYNFREEPRGIISLGLYASGKVIKAGLTKQSSMVYDFRAINEELPSEFSCAVVNFIGGESQALLYGNSQGQGSAEEVLGAVMNSLNEEIKVSQIEKTLDEHGIDYDDDLKEEIDKAIEDEFEKNTCAHCKYREYFYAHNDDAKQKLKLTESATIASSEKENLRVLENLEQKDQDFTQKEDKKSFFEDIKEQVDELFDQNPTEQYLQELIPNSKWVKVEFDESGDYYVFGLLYEDDKLRFVCYGVPGIFQKTPPRQLAGYPVWFPLDKENKEGFGYWLSYQDAESGESIKAVVE